MNPTTPTKPKAKPTTSREMTDKAKIEVATARLFEAIDAWPVEAHKYQRLILDVHALLSPPLPDAAPSVESPAPCDNHRSLIPWRHSKTCSLYQPFWPKSSPIAEPAKALTEMSDEELDIVLSAPQPVIDDAPGVEIKEQGGTVRRLDSSFYCTINGKLYVRWEYAGGPEQCKHGYARCFACPECERAFLVYPSSTPTVIPDAQDERDTVLTDAEAKELQEINDTHNLHLSDENIQRYRELMAKKTGGEYPYKPQESQPMKRPSLNIYGRKISSAEKLPQESKPLPSEPLTKISDLMNFVWKTYPRAADIELPALYWPGLRYGIIDRARVQNVELSDLHVTVEAAWLDAANRLGLSQLAAKLSESAEGVNATDEDRQAAKEWWASVLPENRERAARTVFIQMSAFMRQLIAAKTEKAEESGVSLIAAERARQLAAEGWTPEHDDKHGYGELILAAVAYLDPSDWLEHTSAGKPILWPWNDEWWKPSPDPVRNLVKAGALIAAEIDRLMRRELKKRSVGGVRCHPQEGELPPLDVTDEEYRSACEFQAGEPETTIELQAEFYCRERQLCESRSRREYDLKLMQSEVTAAHKRAEKAEAELAALKATPKEDQSKESTEDSRRYSTLRKESRSRVSQFDREFFAQSSPEENHPPATREEALSLLRILSPLTTEEKDYLLAQPSPSLPLEEPARLCVVCDSPVTTLAANGKYYCSQDRPSWQEEELDVTGVEEPEQLVSDLTLKVWAMAYDAPDARKMAIELQAHRRALAARRGGK